MMTPKEMKSMDATLLNDVVVCYGEKITFGRKKELPIGVAKGAMSMFESLLKAIDKAGGSCSSFDTYEKLEALSANDLIRVLGSNHIRFTYRKRD